jgi:hypothetical protein
VCHECIHNHRAHFFKETVFSCYSKLVMTQLRAFNREEKMLVSSFSLPELKDIL